MYGPKTGYDLKLIFDKSIRHVWNASTSQIYRELAGLESDGQVISQIQPQTGKPDKKIYEITEQGEQAFKDWVNKFPSNLEAPVRDEFLVRIFFGSQISLASLKFQFQKFINEKQEAIEYLEGAKKDQKRLNKEPISRDEFFYTSVAKLAYLQAKTAIAWAEQCIKELEDLNNQR